MRCLFGEIGLAQWIYRTWIRLQTRTIGAEAKHVYFQWKILVQ